MQFFLVSLFVIGVVRGATYEKPNLPAGGEMQQTDVAEPTDEHMVTQHDVPEEHETLAKLEIPKKPTHNRAATQPDVDTAKPAIQSQIVNEHNRLRKLQGATNMQQMSWDADAAKLALAWAQKCDFRHPTQSQAERDQYMKTSKYGCGQNIAYGTGPMSWNDTNAMWYGEIKDFVFGSSPKGVVGHYTAMVWASTYAVGCGYMKCPSLKTSSGTVQNANFFVCDYCPAGNISPNQYSPFEKGTSCAKCTKACNDKLCTNPCPYTNEYSNCDVASGSYPPLITKVPCAADAFGADKCKASCNCRGTKLY